MPLEDYLFEKFKVGSKPVLAFWEFPYLDDWRELRSDATKGFGASDIPSSAIIRWARFKKVPEEQHIFYHAVIRTIDKKAVGFRLDEDEKKSKRASAEQQTKSPPKLSRRRFQKKGK